MTKTQANTHPDITALIERVYRLEAEKLVRERMNHYMAFCNHLDAQADLTVLMSMFTENALWRGIGSRYAKTFGEYKGAAEIEAMFAKYTVEPVHFEFNAHFLCNELIEVADNTATGSWMLIQPSSFKTGESRLSCARISAEFSLVGGDWKISLFTTENLFSRPMGAPWDSNSSLDVPQ